MVLTTDKSYFYALKPRITINSIDDTETYYTFNAHDSPQDLNVSYVDVANAIGESGDFNIVIEDSANIINKDHLRNTKVYIELGKTDESLEHFLIGFADIFDVSVPMSNRQEYRISGFGTQVRADELLLLIRQQAKSETDPNFSIKKLFERSQTERNFRPLNREPLEDVTGWERDIDTDLQTNYRVLNEEFVTLRDFYDRLSSIEGCDWFVDYSTGVEILTARHPIKLHNGKLIKSGDLRVSSDDAEKVSYIKDVFTITDDSSTSAGIKTRLYTTMINEQQTISSNFVNKGSTTLNQRFIAQQVNILNDQRRITDLAFILHKIGDPESPKSRVNGFIIMDEDDKPTGTILGKFSISLNNIEDSTETIFINDIDIKSRFLEGGSKIWIGFTDRSGLKGNVENDSKNTIAWHHDNNLTTHTSGSLSATAVADEAHRDDPTGANWKVSTNGPKYTYSVLSNIRRLLARSNPSAASRLRYKEGFIDSSFLGSTKSVNQFLALNLNPMSKPRRTISNLRVTIPNNFLFRPYQHVTFADGISDITQDLQIVRAAYIMSALPGDPQMGTYSAELTLNGSYNSLIGSCNCL